MWGYFLYCPVTWLYFYFFLFLKSLSWRSAMCVCMNACTCACTLGVSNHSSLFCERTGQIHTITPLLMNIWAVPGSWQTHTMLQNHPCVGTSQARAFPEHVSRGNISGIKRLPTGLFRFINVGIFCQIAIRKFHQITLGQVGGCLPQDHQ